MEPLKVKSHMIKHIIDEKEDCHEVAVFRISINLITVAMMKSVAKKPNETINPTLNQ